MIVVGEVVSSRSIGSRRSRRSRRSRSSSSNRNRNIGRI